MDEDEEDEDEDESDEKPKTFEELVQILLIKYDMKGMLKNKFTKLK